MAVSKRLRFEILRRDNHTCRYCGDTAPNVALKVDHVIAVALGGTDEPGNLVTACQDCNSGKSSMTIDGVIVDDVEQRAIEWGAAMKYAAQERMQEEADRQELWGWFNMIWCQAAEEYNLMNQWHPNGPDVPPDWIDSVAQFLAAGLSRYAIADLVDVAMRSQAGSRGKWKYFCGCCWKQVRALQDRAMEILADENGVH